MITNYINNADEIKIDYADQKEIQFLFKEKLYSLNSNYIYEYTDRYITVERLQYNYFKPLYRDEIVFNPINEMNRDELKQLILLNKDNWELLDESN